MTSEKGSNPNVHHAWSRRKRTTLAAVACASAIILSACTESGSKTDEKRQEPNAMISVESKTYKDTVDLLTDGNFMFMPGAKIDGKGLHVSHRGFTIVNQDGSGGEANPPYNLYGTHLKVEGDFELTAQLTDIEGEAAIELAGQPPVVYDEFRNDRSSLRIAVEADSFWVGLVSPDQPNELMAEDNFMVKPKSEASVTVRRTSDQGGTLTFLYDKKKIGSIKEHGLFDSSTVWLGLDAGDKKGSFTVKSLEAAPLNGGTIETIDTSTLKVEKRDPNGLNTLAIKRRPDFRIGTAISLNQLVSDGKFAEIALNGNFGTFTTENALKAQFVQPERGVYNFKQADAIVDVASRHNMDIHGHALVFGEANPKWMQDLAREHPEQMEAVMLDHVRTVAGRYRGKMQTIDVVNEPLADYDTQPGPYGLRKHIWLESIGPDYIAKAFHAAHEANPEAKLFINDFGLEAHDERWETMRALLERLVQEGVPVHGVGLQSHVYAPGDEVYRQELNAVFKDLEELGLEARISELDVYAEGNTKNQTNQFATILDTCIKNPACTSLTMWGLSERYGSTSYLDGGNLVIGDGLPWDRNLKPLPAVEAMQDVLKSD